MVANGEKRLCGVYRTRREESTGISFVEETRGNLDIKNKKYFLQYSNFFLRSLAESTGSIYPKSPQKVKLILSQRFLEHWNSQKLFRLKT